MKPFLISATRTGVGVALSTAAAIALTLLGPRIGTRALLPWLFVIVLIALSARFGPTVSVIGSVVGMLIFAHQIFAPVGSISVSDAAAKTSLGWMALISITASYLLYPKQNLPRH